MLTRLAHGTLKSPLALEELERAVMERVRRECPLVQWIQSYAILGGYDYVDIFRAPDNEAAVKVSTLVRTFGHASTELWPAMPWGRFKELARELS